MSVERNPLSMRMIPALIAVLLVVSTATAHYSGGTGDPNDPYQIATAADLIALGERLQDYDKHFMLTADIDLDPNLPGRKVFDKAVIGAAESPTASEGSNRATPFTGVFDGRGHVISNLTIVGGSHLGLFAELGAAAQVRNLGLEAVEISGTGCCVGGLAGANGGAIAMSYARGAVRADECVGGLVGLHYGRIVASFSHSSVGGTNGVGGLVGENWAGSIASSYSSGPVSAIDRVGGLVGDLFAFVGGPSVEEHFVTGCFWDTQTSGQIVSAGGTGKTTAEMRRARTFLDAGWDFVGETVNGSQDIWWIFDGRDYPRLWWERVLGDDFEDGKAGPLWFVYEPEPELARIREVNGRLEARTVGSWENVDAIYVSDGWRLDTTKDFAIRVDFHFSKQGAGDGRVTLGVGPSLDPDARRWAELEAGCFDTGPFYLYEVSDGFWVQEVVADRSADEGTLFMSYNSAADELYFSHSGYGKANAWQTVSGLLAGRWGRAPVYVLLGIGSEGMVLTGADAWLDDFAVNVGTLVRTTPDEEDGAED